MLNFLAAVEGGRLLPLEKVVLEEGQEVRVEISPVVREPEASDPAARAEDAPAETAEEGDDPGWDDPLAGIRFDGPPDLAENFDDYRFGRKTWP